jgi:peptide/nickel transport system permease protein
MGVLWYVARRLVLVIPTIVGLSILVFVISRVVPGDPAALAAGERATKETVEKYRREFALDRPLPVQYLLYMKSLLSGDWGRSIHSQRPVGEELKRRFPATFEVAIVALGIAFFVGVPLGLVSALYNNRLPDHVSRIFALSSVSFPRFWLALMLQLLLARYLGLLPVNGRFDPFLEPPAKITGLYLVDSLLALNLQSFWISVQHLILPAITLAIGAMASIARFVRGDVLEAMNRDFVMMERAAGIPEVIVFAKYILKNAFIATLTVMGLFFGFALGGSVLVETVFDWPGIGTYAAQAALFSDFQPIMGVTILIGIVFVVINLVVDLLYGVLDPRIRYG